MAFFFAPTVGISPLTKFLFLQKFLSAPAHDSASLRDNVPLFETLPVAGRSTNRQLLEVLFEK